LIGKAARGMVRPYRDAGRFRLPMTELSASRPRFAVLDIARGVAIIAMAIYHFCWDLAYFRFIDADVGYGLGWVIFGRLVLTAFLLLVGIGLVLGHGRGIRWRAFWKRFAMVAAGALAITVATYFAFPDSFVYFGVLHAIALTSLLALPFLRAPLWLVVAVAAIFIGLPLVYSDPMFDQKVWSWIGFWVVPPPANDLVPVFPWFGVVLLGVLATRLILASCHSTCEAGGTSAQLCVTYCQCGLKGVVDNDLWNAVYTGMVTAQEQSKLDETTRQCSALIYPVAPSAQ
jgi:uncharacterized membrane protein